MTTPAADPDYVDLQFLGRPRIIATAVLHGASGVALIDPGPSTTLRTLEDELERKGIRWSDVRQMLHHPHSSRSRRSDRHDRRAPSARDRSGAREGRAAHGRSDEAAGQRGTPVRGRHGPSVGRGQARPARSHPRASVVERPIASPGAKSRSPIRRATPRTTCRTSTVGVARRVRRRYGRHPPRLRQLRDAPDAAARHRHRRVAHQPGAHPRVGSGVAVRHAFRGVPRRAAALPGDVREPCRLEPHRAAAARRRVARRPQRRAADSSRRCFRELRRRLGDEEAETTTAVQGGSTIPGRGWRGTGNGGSGRKIDDGAHA